MESESPAVWVRRARTATDIISCGGVWDFVIPPVFIRVAKYTTMVDPWQGTVVTDSECVLKTLAGQGLDPQKEPDEPASIDGSTVVLNVLCPDWDILIEIQHALLRLPHLTLQYIQGHQDAKKPYNELPSLPSSVILNSTPPRSTKTTRRPFS